ncbi:MAG: Rieske 2Fe-2S domain-containing protein [Burkholderiales bacterium]
MAGRERLICESTRLVDGGDGVRFEIRRGADNAPAFVVRFRGRPYAYVNRCAHIPVELDWEEGRFFDYSGLYLICATHGATYKPESGQCAYGPCDRRGLIPIAIEERDGGIYLKEDDSTDV